MTYEQILVEQIGAVGVIRLNRPEKLNAWTQTMSGELVQAVEGFNADPAIGAIVITGEGRAFCAGADLGGFRERRERIDAGREEAHPRRGAGPWLGLMRRSKPVIAAINGFAVGVGLTIILPCDIRIAAEGAQLSIRFIKVGLIPEVGSTRLLAQIVGLGHATDMCLSGRLVDANEAHHMGLVSAVVPPDQLMDAALARANELAGNPPTATLMIKELLWKNPLEPDLEAVWEREQVRDEMARRSPEHAEAVRAFLEKRPAVFHS